MAMPQCCYLAKEAKRPSHTTNTIKFDRIPFDPCNSIKRFEFCPFDQKNSTYLQPPLKTDIKYKKCLGYVPISSIAPRPLGAAFIPILPSEVEQEQTPSGKRDREAIVVGAGLCDGEGECAYTGNAPHIIRNFSGNVFSLRRFGIFFLPKRPPPCFCRNVFCRNVRNPIGPCVWQMHTT